MKKKKSKALMQIFTTMLVDMENMENSLTVILGTPECSCVHQALARMHGGLRKAIEIVADISKDS